jgi:choline dehydrogenase-like flavoprotein
MGSFKPGTGVGGAGSHWSGCHFRALPEDFKLRSNVEQRYGAKFIPDDMTIRISRSATKTSNRISITSNTSAALRARPV